MSPPFSLLKSNPRKKISEKQAARRASDFLA
jgi:hypothetical protein